MSDRFVLGSSLENVVMGQSAVKLCKECGYSAWNGPGEFVPEGECFHPKAKTVHVDPVTGDETAARRSMRTLRSWLNLSAPSPETAEGCGLEALWWKPLEELRQ